MQMKHSFIIGITGGSASGKSFFLSLLLNAFPTGKVCLVSQDNYYKPKEHQPMDEKGIYNFDTPSSIDVIQLAHDLNELKYGRKIKRQEYTFNNSEKKPSIILMEPSPVIIVEGLFLFCHPEISRMLDLKIFLDTKEHIKFSRRIFRDKEERGYDLADVLYRYHHHVAPAYEKFIEPLKQEADMIIPNNTHFSNALEVLVTFIKNKFTT
jgi:uridine kinase